ETRLRDAQAALSAQRGGLAQVEQALALAAQSQRDADRQLQQLAVRRERLEQQLQGVQRPDAVRIEQLAGDLAAASERVAEAEFELAELDQQIPQLDHERRTAQQAAQRESAAASAIEARLGALTRLQQDVQQQGEL